MTNNLWVEPLYDNVEGYFREVSSDIAINWTTVHDEVDYIVQKFPNELEHAILKKLSQIGAIKRVMNSQPFPYINFTFDVEWGSDGSWVPDKALNVYEYPCSREERLAKEEWKRLLDEFLAEEEKNKPEPEIPVCEFDFSSLSDSEVEEKLEYFNKLPDGDTKVLIKYGGEIYELDRLVKMS